MEKETFAGGNEYLLSSLELKLKEDDVTKWEDYKKILKLSNLIYGIKKKNLSNINLNCNLTLYNNIKHKDKMFFLERTPKTVTYKYINTKAKQLNSISFQNFQKLYDEDKLAWKTPDNHFVLDVKKVTLNNGDYNYKIIKKKFNKRDFLYVLLLTNTFHVKVGHKVYQSIDWIKYFFENTVKTHYFEGEPVWKLEETRQQTFAHETNFERKIVIYKLGEFRKMNGEQEKRQLCL